MAQEQNYQVNYTINVDATNGTIELQKFADSVAQISKAKTDFTPAITNIKNFMKEIETAFKTGKGRKKDHTYNLTIKTDKAEEKLTKVKTLLTEIGALAKGINVVVNAGAPLETQKIKSQTKKLLNKKELEAQQAETKKTAAEAVKSIYSAQKEITKSIGKINAGLVNMTKERTVNINTDAAKQKLNELLTLLTKVKSSSVFTKGLKLGIASGVVSGQYNGLKYAPVRPFVMSDKSQNKLQEKLYSNNKINQQRRLFKQQDDEAKNQQRSAAEAARKLAKEQTRIHQQNENLQKKASAEEKRLENRKAQQRQQSAADQLRLVHRQSNVENSMYGGKRRAAINRIQYSKGLSMRNMPMAYMFNAYMGYSLMRKELVEAVEYSNIMESAHSILKVADEDLSKFESRFDTMAKYVRKIGVETKFTAIEVAGAVKYLSMAGMGIDTIINSIRPITNLALIGDNDISQIADLTTNIMAGYDIKSTSMGSVADILASTISRSNVNVLEMAESFKMAAGYLKIVGVDFTESAAAIGILGNAGMKGTMAGTSLRGITARFLKQPKEARDVLSKLNVKFTEQVDVYGKQVERLRPLADIFGELKEKGASANDMQTIFGKISGNGAIMLLNNTDKLRALSSQNVISHGVSGELAQVKQNTTKGLWAQVTSQFSESFMLAFEVIEPQIRSVLRSFLSKFKAREFAKGLEAISRVLLDIFSLLGNIAGWVTRNFGWIEPLFFTGFVALKIYKLAAAITNLGIAMGFLGKQSMASSAMQLLGGFTGLGGAVGAKVLTMANKRAIVSTLSAAGISGKGAMTRYLMQAGMVGGAGSLLSRGAASGLFANQVSTGNGVIGATASIAALGSGAIAATAGVAALIGGLGWLAYKLWKVKQAKDAVLEEIEENKQYRYPSIDALNKSLRETYNRALDAKKAIEELTNKSLEDETGQKVGGLSKNSLMAAISYASSSTSYGMSNPFGKENDAMFQAYQKDAVSAIEIYAEKEGQRRLNAAWQNFGKLKTVEEVNLFIDDIKKNYGQDSIKFDSTLFQRVNDKVIYKSGIGDIPADNVVNTPHFADYIEKFFLPDIRTGASGYKDAITNQAGAIQAMKSGGFNFEELEEAGFYVNKDGQWVQKTLGKNATDYERTKLKQRTDDVHNKLVKFASGMREKWGNSTEAVENIFRIAGFNRKMYGNEPDYNDDQPFNANRITNSSEDSSDDGNAGGNYSGTGKLSSAAPKQVIVNITSLLSIEAIKILKSSEGKSEEVQNLKEQLAQALIDVVHDFDASWNG